MEGFRAGEAGCGADVSGWRAVMAGAGAGERFGARWTWKPASGRLEAGELRLEREAELRALLLGEPERQLREEQAIGAGSV